MSRHLTRRTTKPGQRFSWGRAVSADGKSVRYSLFRRSINRRIHAEVRTFNGEARWVIAWELRQMRNRLRDAVDAIDFVALGLLEAA